MKIFIYDNGKVTDLSGIASQNILEAHLVRNVEGEQLIQAEIDSDEVLKIGDYFCGSISMSEDSTLIIEGGYVVLSLSNPIGTIINHGEGNVVVLYDGDNANPYSLKKNTKYRVSDCELTEVFEPLYEIKLVNNLITKEQLNKLALINIPFTSTEVKQ